MNLVLPLAYCVAILLAIATGHAVVLGQDTTESADLLVVVISGFDSDPSPAQIEKKSVRGRGNSGMYQLAGDIAARKIATQFFNWNGTAAGKYTQKNAPGASGIATFIRDIHANNPLKHLILVGHSWGGHTVIDVAKELANDPPIEVALAVCVDPSSFSRGQRPAELPSTIRSCVIYYTHNAFVWGPWLNSNRVENVDLGDAANGFKPKHGRNYSAKFDVSAHTASEWDEGIHEDVLHRINRRIADENPPDN